MPAPTPTEAAALRDLADSNREMARTIRRLRRYTPGMMVTILVLVLVVALGAVLLSRLNDEEHRLASQARTNHNLLTLVQRVTSGDLAAANRAQTELIVRCVENRVDVDTNHAALDPACAALTGRTEP